MHKINTVLRYCYASWANSKLILNQCPNKKRILVYFDLIVCFLRYGADFTDYSAFEFWEKNSKERSSYITLRRNDRLRFNLSTPSVYSLFLDKAAFNKRFSKFVSRGWMTTSDHSIEDLKCFINKYDSVIAKPLSDFGGHGVFEISKIKDDYNVKLDRLRQVVKLGQSYIIEEKIVNCNELKTIASYSLNTLRFVTVLDKEKKLHIIAALLRMGTGTSITDNYSEGGIACPVNIEMGKLCGAAYDINCAKYEIHPYSKIQFAGFQIPNFNKCIEAITEIAYIEPGARYVGWDIALTPGGIELLEGNIPPGQDLTQIATGCGIWYKMLNWI
jgi:hypothetical protein